MIYEELFDYQKSIVDKFYTRDSLGLFLDMGLGKTPLSLALCEKNQVEKILIITINSKALEKESIKGSWAWWTSKSSMNYVISGKPNNKAVSPNNNVLIINYEGLCSRGVEGGRALSNIKLKTVIKDFIEFSENKKVAIILDESHRIKTSSSLTSKAVYKIQSLLKLKSSHLYTYLLTGTPFTTGYIDLLNQLHLLGCKMNKNTFIDNYCIKGKIGGLYEWQQPIIGYKNIDSLYSLIHKYAITIKSNEVINLPNQIFNYIETPQTLAYSLFTKEKYQSNIIYHQLENFSLRAKYEANNSKLVINPFYRNIDYPAIKWMAAESSSFWLRCRQISIGFIGNESEYKWYDTSRLNKLERLLKDNPENYIIFYNYSPELFAIYEICEKLGYNIDVYSGNIKSTFFYERYANSTEPERLIETKNVIISNFTSGSTGMNWQLYNKCIMFSIPLYRDYEQALKRIHRIGQKETVTYFIFKQNNKLDNSMLESLKNKEEYNLEMFKKDLSVK